MESIKILGKATIKQIVDDQYKMRAVAELQAAADKVDEELAKFDKDMSKTMTELTLKGHPQIEQLRRQFNMEREKISIYKEQLAQSIKGIADLPLGSKVDAGEANFIQELKIGDNFALTNCEIIVEGDTVVAINSVE